MCLPFHCGGVEKEDGAPASHHVQSRPPPEQVSSREENGVSSHPVQKPPAPGPLPSSAANRVSKPPGAPPEQVSSLEENGVSSHPVQKPPAPGPLPSSAANRVSKPPGAEGGNKFSPQEPEKFDTARKEGDKKSEKVKQEVKANPDYRISSTTTDYKPASLIEKPNKRDDSAKKGGQDADARSWINQDQRLPSIDGVGLQANQGRINQDQERRASTNEPIREAVDNRFPHADDIGSLANPISRKDQPRRGAHIY